MPSVTVVLSASLDAVLKADGGIARTLGRERRELPASMREYDTQPISCMEGLSRIELGH
jgi:hypothetical protein